MFKEFNHLLIILDLIDTKFFKVVHDFYYIEIQFNLNFDYVFLVGNLCFHNVSLYFMTIMLIIYI